jgi:hypothetical protein
MKFIYEKQEENKTLTLKDVEENQFFVCKAGFLCQKKDSTEYATIADADGNPYCNVYEGSDEENTPIERVLPIVEKIEF